MAMGAPGHELKDKGCRALRRRQPGRDVEERGVAERQERWKITALYSAGSGIRAVVWIDQWKGLL